MKMRFLCYRPVRTPDAGGGGYQETLGESTELFGHFVQNKAFIAISGVVTSEDVQVGDIIEIPTTPA